MTDNKLLKCPYCGIGEMDVYDYEKHPSKDICDTYRLRCNRCPMTWHVAVKKGDTIENVWNSLVRRWRGK